MRKNFTTYLDLKKIPYKDNNSMISFVYREHNYIFLYNENEDPNYIRICLPNIEENDTITEDILRKISRINSSYKVAKVIIVNSQVWISAESFVYNLVGVNQLFDRMIELLHNIIVEYHTS